MDMNNLWASRLNELVEKHKEIEAKEIKKFFQQTTKEERIYLKQLCEERPDLGAVNQKFLRVQKQIATQKVEIRELKYL